MTMRVLDGGFVVYESIDTFCIYDEFIIDGSRLEAEIKGISQLDDCLFKKYKLERISLDENQLTEIPSKIGRLKKLRDLSLYDNQLTTIPESIGNLVNLEDLDLYSNQLTEIPSSFDNLTKLEYLDLEDNNFTDEYKDELRDRFSFVERLYI